MVVAMTPYSKVIHLLHAILDMTTTGMVPKRHRGVADMQTVQTQFRRNAEEDPGDPVAISTWL